MTETGTEAVLAELARTREEQLGHVIGLAAIMACIPGVERIDANAVRGVIDEMLLQFVGAKSDTRAAARRMADKVLSLGRQAPG
jgi:hypothetical protein